VIRPKLLAWQWSDYVAKHRDRGNLPFDGAGDFVTRFVAEQWITFPPFVLSGAWRANLERARPSH
jgi:hypothetical protein